MDVSAIAAAPTTLSAQSRALIGRASSGEGDKANATVWKAAEEFEAVFLSNMLDGMFQGLKTEAPFGGGQGEKAFRSMLVSEYAKGIAATGGIGIAEHVYREILSAQESASQ